jgi:hypothetical protein
MDESVLFHPPKCQVCHAFDMAIYCGKMLGLAALSEMFSEEQLEGFRRHVVGVHQCNPAIFSAEIPA